jgi:2,5-diketo-D-gluconate reductase A
VLADGNEIPRLGLGVWQVPDGPECVDAVRWALELGYRHIDTAQAYRNEKSVGKALSESGLAREDVFITTKFYPGAGTRPRRLGQDAMSLKVSLGRRWEVPPRDAGNTSRRDGHRRTLFTQPARRLRASRERSTVSRRIHRMNCHLKRVRPGRVGRDASAA